MGCKNTQNYNKLYPYTTKTEIVDNYFGTDVADPYRWLEDDNSQVTKDWVVAQNIATENYLKAIPFRSKIQNRLAQLWDFEKKQAPFKKGAAWFYFFNSGLQNQDVLYIANSPEEKGEILLDPNSFSSDGTISLGNIAVSPDGKYLGYAISKGGSDWREIFVMEIASRKILTDHVEWAKFTDIVWYKNGFYYACYPEPAKNDALKGQNTNSMIKYHVLGTESKNDQLIYSDPANPLRGFSPSITSNNGYLIITTTESTTGNGLIIKDLENPKKPLAILVADHEKDYEVVDFFENKLLIYTNYNAPNYNIVAVDLDKPNKAFWTTLIKEKKSVLTECSLVGEHLILHYLQDAHSVVEVIRPGAPLSNLLKLPSLGTVVGFSGQVTDRFVCYSFSSFTTPGVIFKYDILNNQSAQIWAPKTDINPEKYEIKQAFYPSKDGTQIPMFIVHKKGIDLDRARPTLLYGYGGFNISLTPSFSVPRLIWLENDGVIAIANLRGGGEYGETWHQQGVLMNKQNVFDDFIAAANYLINENYCSPNRLTIQGGSNGGLLIGACVNQQPKLFGVALPAVGVMDMLRYHKFTIGRYWATDYGTSEESAKMFQYLHKYSPLHNISETMKYPAIMVTTADHDDRVVPAHSFKYIATLQEKQTGDAPHLIRIETNAGHGAGKPTAMTIAYYADLWSFAFYNMNFTPIY